MEDVFYTHNREPITGKRLEDARREVAQDCRELAHAIRMEDAYASHVTECQKDTILADGLAQADAIERGDRSVNSFTLWQRINQKLTGECVAMLG